MSVNDSRLDAAVRWRDALRRRRQAEKRLRHAEAVTDVRAAAVALDLAEVMVESTKRDYISSAAPPTGRGPV